MLVEGHLQDEPRERKAYRDSFEKLNDRKLSVHLLQPLKEAQEILNSSLNSGKIPVPSRIQEGPSSLSFCQPASDHCGPPGEEKRVETKKEESEGSDDDMGFGLFD